jgi:hypothetical protein
MKIEYGDISKSYIAGIIDGEGCIHIQHQTYGGIETYKVTVIVVQKQTPILKFINAFYVGKMSLVAGKGYGKGIYHRLTLCSDNAIKLLRDVEPYLILKKSSAQVAIQIQEHINGNYARLRGGDTSVLVEREGIYQQFRAAAETERAGSLWLEEGCDSPVPNDGKVRIN